MNERELESLYQWVDEIPLSRPKRNIARDFADACLMAELVHHFFPKSVQLHNYSPAQSVSQKQYNWQTLDQKVFKKVINFSVSKRDIDEVTTCVPGAIERVLAAFKTKVAQEHNKKLHEEHRLLEGRSTDFEELAAGAADEYGGSPHTQQQPLLRYAANPSTASSKHPTRVAAKPDYTEEIIQEKDETIHELRETIDILEIKIKKLEQLLEIKDKKIGTLNDQLNTAAPLMMHQMQYPSQQVLQHETPMQEHGVAWADLTSPFRQPPNMNMYSRPYP